MLKPRKKTVAITTAAFVVAGSTAALAYWTTTGSGLGAVGTQSPSGTVEVTQASGEAAGLYPGGPGFNLTGSLKNNSTGPVRVTGVKGTITGTDKGASCLASNYSFNQNSSTQTETATYTPPQTLNADATIAWAGLTVYMLETGANQNDCRGAKVNIAYEITS